MSKPPPPERLRKDLPFTPEVLDSYAHCVADLRCEWLFDTDAAGADPIAEQHYLAALSHMEAAQHSFSLAMLHQTAAIGGKR